MQQAIEGVFWIGVNTGNAELVSAASRGSLFFSQLFWLAWPSFASFWVAPRSGRRAGLLSLAIAGALFGLLIVLPAFL
jgi:hypothetical protein